MADRMRDVQGIIQATEAAKPAGGPCLAQILLVRRVRCDQTPGTKDDEQWVERFTANASDEVSS